MKPVMDMKKTMRGEYLMVVMCFYSTCTCGLLLDSTQLKATLFLGGLCHFCLTLSAANMFVRPPGPIPQKLNGLTALTLLNLEDNQPSRE